MAETSM